jgi:cysteine synthase
VGLFSFRQKRQERGIALGIVGAVAAGDEEALLVGASSGAAAGGALEAARQTGARAVVTILPDTGDRYFPDGFCEAT